MTSEVAKPFAFAFIVIGITNAFSLNAGAAINPVCVYRCRSMYNK